MVGLNTWATNETFNYPAVLQLPSPSTCPDLADFVSQLHLLTQDLAAWLEEEEDHVQLDTTGDLWSF